MEWNEKEAFTTNFLWDTWYVTFMFEPKILNYIHRLVFRISSNNFLNLLFSFFKEKNYVQNLIKHVSEFLFWEYWKYLGIFKNTVMFNDDCSGRMMPNAMVGEYRVLCSRHTTSNCISVTVKATKNRKYI